MVDTSDSAAGPPEDPSGELIRRAQAGDDKALEALMSRYLPAVARWARGRLPLWARDSMNTDDLVQDVFMRTIPHVGTFEARRPGAMTAYLRQAVLHRIRDEIRKVKRKPAIEALGDDRPARDPSPHEQAEAAELMDSYETALARLKEDDREAIIARVELKLPYREIAALLDKPSEEAAQMAVSRALIRLAREMGRKP